MKNGIRVMLTVLLCVLVLIITASCVKSEVSLGFIGGLSGKNSQLSIDARNALLLGVDEVNQKGGVKGHTIKLVVKDDKGDFEEALLAHKSFKNEGVSLVIGHMTSNMVEAIRHSQSEEMIFLSPTMGAASLTGIDDYFLRTSPLVNYQATLFHQFVLEKEYKKIAIVYDLMNSEYTEVLTRMIQEESGELVDIDVISFDSRVDSLRDKYVSWEGIQKYDLIFMISQAIDTAVLSQLIRKDFPMLQLASVSWSMTEDLLINGGQAVEGMYFIGVYQSEQKSDRYRDFDLAYTQRFNYPPSFVSKMAYDAFYAMVHAMEKAESFKPKDVKRELINLVNFEGLDEVFSMDAFGDNNRQYLLYQLRKGEFIPLYGN